MLPDRIRSALIDVVERLLAARIDHALGGSAMLRLRGLDVSVADIDIVVAASSRSAVLAALSDVDLEDAGTAGPWRSGWLLRAEWPTPSGGVGLDILGGPALEIDGAVARFPVVARERVVVSGTEIPLAPLAHWYHLYRVHDPGKAALIAGSLSDAEITAAAEELGLS